MSPQRVGISRSTAALRSLLLCRHHPHCRGHSLAVAWPGRHDQPSRRWPARASGLPVRQASTASTLDADLGAAAPLELEEEEEQDDDDEAEEDEDEEDEDAAGLSPFTEFLDRVVAQHPDEDIIGPFLHLTERYSSLCRDAQELKRRAERSEAYEKAFKHLLEQVGDILSADKLRPEEVQELGVHLQEFHAEEHAALHEAVLDVRWMHEGLHTQEMAALLGSVRSFEEAKDVQALQDFVEFAKKIDRSLLPSQESFLSMLLKQIPPHMRRILKTEGLKTQEMKEQRLKEHIGTFIQNVNGACHKKLGTSTAAAHFRPLLALLVKCAGLHAELYEELLFAAGVASQQQSESSFPGSRWRVLTERALHIDMLEAPARFFSNQATPDPAKTILLSNLPLWITADALREALPLGGEIQSVEFGLEWMDPEQHGPLRVPLRSQKVAIPQSELLRDTRLYAIVEFATEDGCRQVTRTAVKLFGILLPELLEVPPKSSSRGRRKKDEAADDETSAAAEAEGGDEQADDGAQGEVAPPRRQTQRKRKPKPVTRPAYPQEASLKRTLLIKSLPWQYEISEILSEITRLITAVCPESTATCEMKLTNGNLFTVQGTGCIESLSVKAERNGGVERTEIDVRQELSSDAAVVAEGQPLSSWSRANDGIAMIRCRDFAEAYTLRRVLDGTIVKGRRISCGFPVQRPRIEEIGARPD